MWVAILGRYIKIIRKPTNIVELKTELLQYVMMCHRSSLIRQPCDFERDFDFVLLQLAVADTLNTQFKYREGSWHSLLKRLKCWRKSCAKFDSLRLTEYSGRDCMFTWKNELQSLNCCICWTVFVISIKFAGYVDRIFFCRLCKFDKYICYNFRDMKFFLGGYFLARPVLITSNTQILFSFL